MLDERGGDELQMLNRSEMDKRHCDLESFPNGYLLMLVRPMLDVTNVE